MEVCGTHTVELRKQGIHSVLPPSIRLISGPGCPVCVTPAGYIDNALALADSGRAIVATFGDMLKVPGSDGRSLSSLTGKWHGPPGVLSPRARRHCPRRRPSRRVPRRRLRNDRSHHHLGAAGGPAGRDFESLPLHGLQDRAPALRFLLSNPTHAIDGFLLPGHVSVIIGAGRVPFPGRRRRAPGSHHGIRARRDAPGDSHGAPPDSRRGKPRGKRIPAGGAFGGEPAGPGSHPADPRASKRRVARPRGDPRRRARRCAPSFADSDAEAVFALPPARDYEAPGCLCSRVVTGMALPTECGLFGSRCTPDDPVGPCMVSSEGTCAAYFRYGGGG